MMGGALQTQVNQLKEAFKASGAPKEIMARAFSIMDDLICLRAERDRVAHSMFFARVNEQNERTLDVATRIYRSWQADKEHEWKPLTSARLKEIAGRMEVRFWDIQDFLREMHQAGRIPQKP